MLMFCFSRQSAWLGPGHKFWPAFSFYDFHVSSIFCCCFGFSHITWLAGSQFPDQGLNLGHGSESAESWPLDHQVLTTPISSTFKRPWQCCWVCPSHVSLSKTWMMWCFSSQSLVRAAYDQIHTCIAGVRPGVYRRPCGVTFLSS